MRFSVSTHIPFPLPAVYSVYRDHFGEVALNVENVHRVEVSAVRPVEGGLQHRQRWHGRVNLPLPTRRYLSEEMLVWDAHVHWHNATTSCRWTLRALHFAQHVRCQGSVTLSEAGPGQTRAAMEGELRFDLTGIRFIPRSLHAVVAHRMEAFIGARIEQNFAGVGRRVAERLGGASAMDQVREDGVREDGVRELARRELGVARS